MADGAASEGRSCLPHLSLLPADADTLDGLTRAAQQNLRSKWHCGAGEQLDGGRVGLSLRSQTRWSL